MLDDKTSSLSSDEDATISSQSDSSKNSPTTIQSNKNLSPPKQNPSTTPTSDTSDSELQDLSISLNVDSIPSTSRDNDHLDVRPPSSIIHNHILPPGWICNYRLEEDKYEFEYVGEIEEAKISSRRLIKSVASKLRTSADEAIQAKSPTLDNVAQTSRRATLDNTYCRYGYHFPTSPTPSMLSELAKQVNKAPATAPPAKVKQFGYGKTKLTMLSDEEEQAKRLREMFPTATAAVVDQMIKIYQGREGCIKAALISLGYKRDTDYGAQQATAQSPIMLMMLKPSSKKLFDKLVGYFPDKDETLIKNLMYQHKEVEHEIISTLVESGGYSEIKSKESSGIGKMDKNGAIMKLRYLKFLFPTCEEIELYHLLYHNDLNAQKVIEIIEKKGHKKANIEEVMQNRKTQTQQMKAQQAALAAKEKATFTSPLELHNNRIKRVVTEDRINNYKKNLIKSLGDEAEMFTDGSLLAALQASDYSESLAKKFLQDMGPIDASLYKQRYVIKREVEPDVVLYPCKGIQKIGDKSFMSVVADDYVAIPREVVECETAIALLKIDASTSTQDDVVPIRFTHRSGHSDQLREGSIYKTLEVIESKRVGSKSHSLRIGSQYEKMCADPNRRKPGESAEGRKILPSGKNQELKRGHNPKLLERIHPFFKQTDDSSNLPRRFLLIQ